MNYSIIIVTYNRCDLLKECISCALNQTIPANHIIVVNNASTDTTKEYLDSFGDARVIVEHMQENTGGAGGFYMGMQTAHLLGDEMHIIIDDDAMLSPDFAEILIGKAQEFPKIMAFAGSVLTDGNVVAEHRQIIKRPGYRMKKIEAAQYEKDIFYCDTASFCGLMIRDKVIELVGLPEKKYFIWYDDTEYCIRIRKFSNIMVVPKAKLNHKVLAGSSEWPRSYTWKDYYGIRNRIHMVKKHGNFEDYIVLRIWLIINSGIRNRIFHILKFHNKDWKNEMDIYKRAVKDSSKFIKQKD